MGRQPVATRNHRPKDASNVSEAISSSGGRPPGSSAAPEVCHNGVSSHSARNERRRIMTQLQIWHHGLVARAWAEFETVGGQEAAYFQAVIETAGQPALDL